MTDTPAGISGYLVTTSKEAKKMDTPAGEGLDDEPIYCPKCGGCGIDGCCDARMCRGGEGCKFPRPWMFEEVTR